MDLSEVIKALEGVPPEAIKDKFKAAFDATKNMRWLPNPGPQTDALFSDADELFYGGQAGGGKTDLALGAALNYHKRSLILRRTNKEAKGLVERMTEIVGNRNGWNSQDGAWRIDGRFIELGGCEHEEDKQKRKGIAHDLKCFDEVSDFTETQYTFIIGWNRSADKEQRCRVIATGNPPTTPEGMWVLRRWAAWLDPQYPNPAKPGELRWFTTINGQDTEVDGRGPHLIADDKGGVREVYARSRTFIPAQLSDNPDLRETDYASVLDALPEEYRSAYRDGNFGAGIKDDEWQCIPAEWVRAAQARWEQSPPDQAPMCCIGQDVAQGGTDYTVLAKRHNYWIAPLVKVPGLQTPDGQSAAGLAIQHRRDGAEVQVDIGGGWGGDTYAHLRENGVNAKSYMGIKVSNARTRDKLLKFKNIRTQAYWQLREMLDPSQDGGSRVMLPPGATLLADLCAPRYTIKGQATGGNGIIELESKESVKERLGRSPDEGDAVVMAFHGGPFHVNFKGGDMHPANKKPKPTTAIMGRQPLSHSVRRH